MVLLRIIEQLCKRYKDTIVIGDFNLHSCPINVCNYFQCFQTHCGFTQSNEVGNCNDRQLDLTFGSDGSVSVRAAEAPLVPVDAYHPPLDVTVSLRVRQRLRAGSSPPTTGTPEPTGWNFNKADFPLLYSSIAAVDWDPMYNLDLQTSLNYFYDHINTILDDCVPRKKRSRVTSRYHYPEWYTVELIRDIKAKAILHKRYKTSGARTDYEAFSQCRTKVKKSISCAREQYAHRVQSQMLEDPKSFWNYAKSRQGSRSPRKILKNDEEMTDEQCVQEFAEYLYSVYDTEEAALNVSSAMIEAGGDNGAALVHLDYLQLPEVCGALQQLKPKRSSGPDGIPPYILKDCRSTLAKPLQYIYNKCLEAEVIPEMWKVTRVVPVPKGGPGTGVDGYRPVAVLSTPAKVFEAAIHKSIFQQVSSQLSDAQHGFRPARSTTSNFLSHMANLLLSVDSGGQIDVVYFDFKKAFDLVNNDILLKKLAAVGFTPHLLRFDRQQYVEYEGHKSEPYFTRSGVSQGSNLGPLEFILMINDLPKVVKDAQCLLFADDLKLSLEINELADCDRLQRDIDAVVAWSTACSLTSPSVWRSLLLACVLLSPIVTTWTGCKLPELRKLRI
ncbi:hypothetical protein PYW07_007639 [Mythimna separata]|uniref:Reverse transcriptase domain-containing protein n=1 Tax=Mythimna separata TaxID=271217 RepID=A0AAD7YRA0_MYTSE|nr:hypothetical protein PYW07_007639 [Mythimna separata]